MLGDAKVFSSELDFMDETNRRVTACYEEHTYLLQL